VPASRGSILVPERVGRLQGLAAGNPFLCNACLRRCRGRCPPGFHPPQGLPHRVRRTAVAARSAHALSLTIVSLAGHDRKCASACCQTQVLAWSLSRLPALPRFFPWAGPPMQEARRCWDMGSPRGRLPVAGPPAPRFAPPRLLTGAQWVNLSGPHRATFLSSPV
jgi:hypothetical protein